MFSWYSRVFLIVHCIFYASATPLEDHYETEIDPREPRSFKSWEMHSVRQATFNEIVHHDADDKVDNTIHINNWEVFATSYWYETRNVNMSCPMTPQGIAATCDWALMVPCLFGDITKSPKTIFVHTLMLPHFAESTLRFLNDSFRFVLISGSTDQTVPNGSGDTRYKTLRNMPQGMINWNRIINSETVVHWFAENKDAYHPKLSTLPTGLCGQNPDNMTDLEGIIKIPITSRPLLVMSADRHRSGSQWLDRYNVQVYCKNRTFCMDPSRNSDRSELNRTSYLKLIAAVPFVACVHGGGLDPSPKAWETILAGTIPIIQRSQIADAYEHLPVAFVNNWQELFLVDEEEGRKKLSNWLMELAPYYIEGSDLRQRTLNRLKTAYWLEHIKKKIETHHNTTLHPLIAPLLAQ
jgi:hypothetical protein